MSNDTISYWDLACLGYEIFWNEIDNYGIQADITLEFEVYEGRLRIGAMLKTKDALYSKGVLYNKGSEHYNEYPHVSTILAREVKWLANCVYRKARG